MDATNPKTNTGKQHRSGDIEQILPASRVENFTEEELAQQRENAKNLIDRSEAYMVLALSPKTEMGEDGKPLCCMMETCGFKVNLDTLTEFATVFKEIYKDVAMRTMLHAYGVDGNGEKRRA